MRRIASRRREAVAIGARFGSTIVDRGRIELAGLIVLSLLTITVAVHLLAGGFLVGQDSLTQFYPWYAFLGERLRAGEIPGWNPAQFAGAPFAGDPQSGWTYLPAMLIFLLPLAIAAPIFVLFHTAMAMAAVYALGRALGEGVIGALAAAAAYGYAGPMLARAPCCPATYQVAAWSPVALLGLELAVRSHTWIRRGAGWGLSGLALSQIIAAWIGQGSYYALLALGAYAAYRTLFAPTVPPGRPAPPLWSRAGALVLHGGALLTIGFGLAAAGILPRLEYNAESNLAGGRYQGSGDWAASLSGVSMDRIDRALDPTLYYPGGASIALGVIALILARQRRAVPYAASIALLAAILVLPVRTPLHSLLYNVLPRFEALHRHWPERVTMVAYIAPALLAGTAVGSLTSWRRRPKRLIGAASIPLVIGLVILLIGPRGVWPAFAAVIVSLLAMATLLPRPIARYVPVLMLLLVAGDLFGMARLLSDEAPFGGFHRMDLGAYDRPAVGGFLHQRTDQDPARFFGFDPGLGTVEEGRSTLYRPRFADPRTAALLVNNRATLFDLEDVQGYNPVQPQRWVEFLTALNGATQEYHDANVLPGGIDSPLLDLIGARYILVPGEIPPGRDDLLDLVVTYPSVYGDDFTRVLERRSALPRAWLVHQAQSVSRGDALAPLAAGAVDPRQVALVEGIVPELRQPADATLDRVEIVHREPERLALTTRSEAPAMLVVGQTYDPGWRATIDGVKTPVLPADHLLQAVAVPAGDHTIELRYESPALRQGLQITMATIVAYLLFMLVSIVRQRWQRDRR